MRAEPDASGRPGASAAGPTVACLGLTAQLDRAFRVWNQHRRGSHEEVTR